MTSKLEQWGAIGVAGGIAATTVAVGLYAVGKAKSDYRDGEGIDRLDDDNGFGRLMAAMNNAQMTSHAPLFAVLIFLLYLIVYISWKWGGLIGWRCGAWLSAIALLAGIGMSLSLGMHTDFDDAKIDDPTMASCELLFIGLSVLTMLVAVIYVDLRRRKALAAANQPFKWNDLKAIPDDVGLISCALAFIGVTMLNLFSHAEKAQKAHRGERAMANAGGDAPVLFTQDHFIYSLHHIQWHPYAAMFAFFAVLLLYKLMKSWFKCPGAYRQLQ